MPGTKTLYELKETAKWSRDPQEMKAAIRELSSSYGEEALEALQEILNVTAYEDVKAACSDVIKAIKEKSKVIEEKADQTSSDINSSSRPPSPRTTTTTTSAPAATDVVKKKEEVEEEKTR